jgi:uncharacterized domain 1
MDDYPMIEKLIMNDPFINYLGIKVRILGDGKAEATVDFKKELMRSGDIMNGGAIASLIDTAGGTAVLTLSKSNQVTVNLNLNFLKAIDNGPVKAVAEVTKPGNRIFYVDVKVYDGKSNMCAHATGVWYAFR